MTGITPSPDPTPSPDSAASGRPTPSEPTLAALAAAGFSIDALNDEQHDVLRGLTAEELTLLIDIKGRLDEAAPEVQAHIGIPGAELQAGEVAGGALF
ncbi:aroma-sacti cluster domain-containing protein [Streptomyces sp. NPDC057271]|uniref:aroma-sacti cluster domain-containing protein n=1 Tax=unclassified Streptomyces TaxID=2593676 RepID=UPI00363F50E3